MPPPMRPGSWSLLTPLEDFCPVYKDQKNGSITTQYSMKYVEKIGLVKFDFLGLKNLTVIDNAVKLVRAGKEPSSTSPCCGTTTRQVTSSSSRAIPPASSSSSRAA